VDPLAGRTMVSGGGPRTVIYHDSLLALLQASGL
jgi:hypothetical protein